MATIGKELSIKGLAVFAHYHRFPELYKDYIEPVTKVSLFLLFFSCNFLTDSRFSKPFSSSLFLQSIFF